MDRRFRIFEKLKVEDDGADLRTPAPSGFQKKCDFLKALGQIRVFLHLHANSRGGRSFYMKVLLFVSILQKKLGL